MSQAILKSEEFFIRVTNETITPPFELGYYSIATAYHEAKSDTINSDEALALDLGSLICSLSMNPESANDSFQLAGRSLNVPDDITDADLEFMSRIYVRIKNPMVRARISDLLWLLRKPKNIDHARSAINSYLSLPICAHTWTSGVSDCWKRAIRLALQLNYSESIPKIESSLLEAFEKDYPSSPFMNLWIAEIIEQQNLCKSSIESISHSLLQKAERFHSSNSFRECQKYSSLSEKIFNRLSNEEQELKSLTLYADSFELEGDSRLNTSSPSQFIANTFYEKALQAYRRVPAKFRDEFDVNDRINKIKHKISSAGRGSLNEMSLIQSPSIDITESVKSSRNHVAGKESLDLALLYFTGFPAPNFQQLRAQTIKSIREFPLSNMFGGTHIAGDGRVIAKTAELGFTGESIEGDATIFNKTVQGFHHHIQCSVRGNIGPALHQILSEHRVTKEFLQKICLHSPMVPEGREGLMANALWFGFEHDFQTSIHLLSPQVEHLVRTVLKKQGAHTSTIDINGIENENGLATLLNHEHAINLFGEDLLFELKAVFTESIGSNLRNEVAHGLLDDQSSRSMAGVYAWWMILRIIIRSLYNSEQTND